MTSIPDWFRRAGRERAFSLVELLAVMSIAVVVVSLVSPVTTGVIGAGNLNAAIDCAWSAASAARQQAISAHAPVALVFTVDRQAGDAAKSDAFILMQAHPLRETSGAVAWQWQPAGPWRKLQRGVQLSVGADQAGDGPSFYCSTSVTGSSNYDQIVQSLPRLEGDLPATYYFAVFRPDGSVDVPSSNPYLEFKRLRAGIQTNDSALVLSPDSGRVRLCQYK